MATATGPLAQHASFDGRQRRFVDTEQEPLVPIKPLSEQPLIRRSINILTLTVFLQSTGFTLMLPSQWLYMQSVGSTQEFYGYAIGVYSIGQLLGSLAFGYWANHRPTREALLVSLTICLLGNLWYSIAYLLPDPQWQIFVARFFVGFGAGNISTSRAYMSEATSLSEKVAVMAKMSAAQAIGFVMGPAIGFAVAFINFHIGRFVVNEYTAPALLAVITAGGNLAMIPGITELKRKARGGPQAPKTQKREWIAMTVAMFLFFDVTAVFAVFESTCVLITQNDFGWRVWQNGILFFAAGAESVVIFIIISRPFWKRFNDRSIFQVGMAIQVVGLCALATYGPPFNWETRLPIWQFLLGVGIMSIGYPVATALVYALFSKVIDPDFQGAKMGYHNASGCVARIVGPIWATSAYAYTGPGGGGEILFFGTAGFVLLGVVVCAAFWRFLTPHEAYANPVRGIDIKPEPLHSSVKYQPILPERTTFPERPSSPHGVYASINESL
eukprot:TRINITY_DN10179_c0_g1_i1.p1 TRINITY_DN10179_c0_g1~~TRINITY_DN10179_c0_g1_i1.p1  ORF type:complete len:499 (-),score=111.46 TRINITY_DN10179_c0_g1_i1:532-2028(-)